MERYLFFMCKSHRCLFLTQTVKWPKGELQHTIPQGVEVTINDAEIVVTIVSNEYKNLRWLTRTLLSNMIEWVTKGYEKKLQLIKAKKALKRFLTKSLPVASF